MWRYLLLGMPILGLPLFFVLSFELALFIYLTVVVLAFFLYYKLQERTQTQKFGHANDLDSAQLYRKR